MLSSQGESLNQSYEHRQKVSKNQTRHRQNQNTVKTKPRFYGAPKAKDSQKAERLIRQANQIIEDSLR